jgi:hypothetical protein
MDQIQPKKVLKLSMEQKDYGKMFYLLTIFTIKKKEFTHLIGHGI